MIGSTGAMTLTTGSHSCMAFAFGRAQTPTHHGTNQFEAHRAGLTVPAPPRSLDRAHIALRSIARCPPRAMHDYAVSSPIGIIDPPRASDILQQITVICRDTRATSLAVIQSPNYGKAPQPGGAFLLTRVIAAQNDGEIVLDRRES